MTILASCFPKNFKSPKAGTNRPDGYFIGKLFDHRARWVVEFTSARALAQSSKWSDITGMLEQYGHEKYDAILIITDTKAKKLEETARAISYKTLYKHVEIKTIAELEEITRFDTYSSPYPGDVVTIGHNSVEYMAAIEAVDEVLDRLQTSNSHGLTANIRDRLLVEVQAGRTLLGGRTIRITSLAETIVPALKFIAENSASAVVGEIAKSALKYLVKLIFS